MRDFYETEYVHIPTEKQERKDLKIIAWIIVIDLIATALTLVLLNFN